MMRILDQLEELVCKQLEEYTELRELAGRDLETVHQLTDTLKNIYKIMAAEDGGYSRAGDWEAEMRGNYGRESSYARRGMHYVRGHYSREDGGGSGDGGSSQRGYSNRRRYSRDDGKEEMISQLADMMETADEKGKEAIRRCMQQLEKG